MILNAVSRFCLVITAIAFSLGQSDPLSFVVTAAFVGAMLIFDSFARIFLFDAPKKHMSSNSKSLDPTEKPTGTTIAGEENL
jgi:hypothetical protein